MASLNDIEQNLTSVERRILGTSIKDIDLTKVSDAKLMRHTLLLGIGQGLLIEMRTWPGFDEVVTIAQNKRITTLIETMKEEQDLVDRELRKRQSTQN